jgi:hypothetical protein
VTGKPLSPIPPNPTQAHHHLAVRHSQSRFTTWGNSGLRTRGEWLIPNPASESSRISQRTKGRINNAYDHERKACETRTSIEDANFAPHQIPPSARHYDASAAVNVLSHDQA